MLLKALSAGPIGTNCYLIACSKTHQAIVIDTPFDSARWIHSEVQNYSLKICMILLTHSHWDHIAEAALLKNKSKAPLYIHEEDAANLKVPGSDGLALPLPIAPVEPDAFLSNGQHILLGELEIEVIHTPGHSPGSVCFYLPKHKVLFSGDTLFQDSMGKVSFPTSSPSAMWTSLKKLSTLPPDTNVYPGHGDATTIGDENWLTRAEKRFSS